MIKGEAPFVRGTPEEVGRGNRIHTFNTLTSDSHQLLLVWWRHLIMDIHIYLYIYVCVYVFVQTKDHHKNDDIHKTNVTL